MQKDDAEMKKRIKKRKKRSNIPGAKPIHKDRGFCGADSLEFRGTKSGFRKEIKNFSKNAFKKQQSIIKGKGNNHKQIGF